MFVHSKILLVVLVVTAATLAASEETSAQSRSDTRRLSGAFIRRRKPAVGATGGGEGGQSSPYAVPMEPLVKYSQRDPLYDKSRNLTATPGLTSRGDYHAAGTNTVLKLLPPRPNNHYNFRPHPRPHPHPHPHPQPPPPPQHHYYQEPEPIIEIIIKESNESLPAPTTEAPPPAPPATKEPVHVFYVKYKTNPNSYGKEGESDIIYEPPVPAISQHHTETEEPEPEAPHDPAPPATEQPYQPPPPSTTLRTIIRPDSETYHGSGLKVTFGSPGQYGRSEPHELEGSASEVEPKLPEPKTRDETFNRDLFDSQPTSKPHYFKRQQGPYYPPPNHNLQQLTPPHPGQQFQRGPPQTRQQAPNQATQVYFNRGNNKGNYAPLPFRQQQQTGVGFQKPQQFNPSQQQQGPERQTQRFNEPVGAHRQSGQPQNEYRQENRRPQFQPTLEAQIEEYQKHKLYLHQQNLRQQAEEVNQAQQTPQNANRVSQPQTIHIQIPQNFQAEHGNFHIQVGNHQEPIVKNNDASQNLVTPQPPDQKFFRPSQPSPTLEASAPVNPSQQVPARDQVFYTQHAAVPEASVQSTQRTPAQKHPFYHQHSLTEGNLHAAHSYNGDHGFGSRSPSPIYNNAEIVKTISPIRDIDIPNSSSGKDQTPIKNEPTASTEKQNNINVQYSGHEEVQTPNHYQNQNSYSNHKTSPNAENHRYEPVYTPTTNRPRPVYTAGPSSTYSSPPRPVTSSTPAPEAPQEATKSDSEPESADEKVKKQANLAALPDEVPDDLREQLLSSGILGNADIQILDYDKVGDIPIESLPPEALENLYGAGSAPVATVVKPDGSLPNKKPVEMKVVRYDPKTKEGQGLAETYVREDATQVDPVVLNDSRYNRYLPLKISGSNFPLPDIPLLKNRIVNSVVVLAPVDYDFIKNQEDVDRAGRTVQVEGVRFIAGDSLKTLVKDPTSDNYLRWLEKEKETPTGRQSVVLLVTSPTSSEKSSKAKKMEIFMYDVSTAKVSKLRGELSAAFVEVAESNSGSEELEELADSDERAPQV